MQIKISCFVENKSAHFFSSDVHSENETINYRSDLERISYWSSEKPARNLKSHPEICECASFPSGSFEKPNKHSDYMDSVFYCFHLLTSINLHWKMIRASTTSKQKPQKVLLRTKQCILKSCDVQAFVVNSQRDRTYWVRDSFPPWAIISGVSGRRSNLRTRSDSLHRPIPRRSKG